MSTEQSVSMRCRKRSPSAVPRLVTVALIAVMSGSPVAAWSSSSQRSKSFHHRSAPDAARRNPMTMYVPASTPTTETASLTAQKMLKNAGRVSDTPRRKSPVKLSQSVLASCDTLPSFPTAHGILSPETVMRMEELTRPQHRSEALVNFLKTYRRDGPMSCLSMLSDPEVLPHLTNAMRDVVA